MRYDGMLSTFNSPQVIKRHSVASLMMSLKFVS